MKKSELRKLIGAEIVRMLNERSDSASDFYREKSSQSLDQRIQKSGLRIGADQVLTVIKPFEVLYGSSTAVKKVQLTPGKHKLKTHTPNDGILYISVDGKDYFGLQLLKAIETGLASVQ